MVFNVTGGGGTSLNFAVKAYATEAELLAAKPKENTIGIITETPITSWIFSATEPSPAVPGQVWITTGTSSTVAFNALKKNGILVYPLSAKQYVGGVWVSRNSQIYQGSTWKSAEHHLPLYVQNWAKMPNITYAYTLDYTDDVLTFSASKGVTDRVEYAGIYFTEPIDLTNYSKLRITGAWTKNATAYFGIGLTNDLTITQITDAAACINWSDNSFTGEKVLDVRALSGEFYLVMTLGVGDGVTVTAKTTDFLFEA